MYVLLGKSYLCIDPLNILEGMFFSSFFFSSWAVLNYDSFFARNVILLLFVTHKGRSIKNVLHRYMISFFYVALYCVSMHNALTGDIFFLYGYFNRSIDEMCIMVWFQNAIVIYKENWEQFWGHLRIVFANMIEKDYREI